MNFEPNKCASCHGTERVVTLKLQVRYRAQRVVSENFHICETCMMSAEDLAQVALEVQGGVPTLAEQFGEAPARPINRTLFVIASTALKAYKSLRGIA